MLQDLSPSDGSTEIPEKDVSGKMRLPIKVLEGKWWNKYRDGEDKAMMMREGCRGVLGFGLENSRKGKGRDGDGATKLLRSS